MLGEIATRTIHSTNALTMMPDPLAELTTQKPKHSCLDRPNGAAVTEAGQAKMKRNRAAVGTAEHFLTECCPTGRRIS